MGVIPIGEDHMPLGILKKYRREYGFSRIILKSFRDGVKKRKNLKNLKKEIQAEVMKNEETFKVADVVVKFNSPKRSFDYESAGSTASEEIIKANTDTITTTNWKAVCEAMGLEKDKIPCTYGGTVTFSIKGRENVEAPQIGLGYRVFRLRIFNKISILW